MSTTTKDEQVSASLWYGSLIATAFTIGGILIVLAIILSGATDPQPVGDLHIDDAVVDQDRWSDLTHLTSGQLGFGIDPAWTIERYDIPYQLSVPGTVEVRLQQITGPTEAAFGFGFRGSDHRETLIRLNGSGYLGITRTYPDDTTEDIYTWRPFPHVHGSGLSNQIWITIENGHAQVRINEEVAAEFDGILDGLYELDWYVETFETGGVEIAVESFRLWADQ